MCFFRNIDFLIFRGLESAGTGTRPPGHIWGGKRYQYLLGPRLPRGGGGGGREPPLAVFGWQAHGGQMHPVRPHNVHSKSSAAIKANSPSFCFYVFYLQKILRKQPKHF